MYDFFELNQDFEVVIKDEVWLIPEFEALLDKDFNIGYVTDPNGKQRTKCFAIIKYIYLMYAWKSPNAQLSARDRHDISLEQASIEEAWLEDMIVIKAIKSFLRVQETRTSKMLDSVNKSIDKFRIYFDDVDLDERDPLTNKPIFTVKDLLANISQLEKAYDGLERLENRVKKERAEQKALKGDTEPGMFDMINYR